MMVHGLGVTEHVQGTDGVAALVNLALLTGNIGKAGAGVNPLRGQNNVQGAAQMGCDPGLLCGGIPIADSRSRTESVWGRPLPVTPGQRLLEMMAAARDGRLKALVVVGYDILLTNPDMASTRQALESLDLLIVLDMFHTQTSGLAHIFLPAASSFEKDGTFMNAERRVQRVRKVIAPVGDARSDAVILSDLASAMGAGAGFGHPGAREIWKRCGRYGRRFRAQPTPGSTARVSSGRVRPRITPAPSVCTPSGSPGAGPSSARSSTPRRGKPPARSFPSCSSPAAPCISSTPAR